MWQNILILFIIVACFFFIGRRTYRQLKGSQASCGDGCNCCNNSSVKTKGCETKEPHPLP